MVNVSMQISSQADRARMLAAGTATLQLYRY